ncbi:MAG: hypothetical protein GTO41_06375 [Burkholderiales bacterium]|nr:hypothetical protein [Burkholderiales bacterium]
MSATKVIVGTAALGFLFAACTVGAVPHRELITVSPSGNKVIVRAAEHIDLDGPVISENIGQKDCGRSCIDRNYNIPASN